MIVWEGKYLKSSDQMDAGGEDGWHAHTATINDDPIVLTSFRHVIVLTEL